MLIPRLIEDGYPLAAANTLPPPPMPVQEKVLEVAEVLP
jgi:hypothetical protein